MAWYTAGSGATCVAAYDAVGAASLADSYTNEANPGTYTAAPGVAPTWAYGTGWTFNGSTQYLTTGVAPGAAYSVIVRFSGAPVSGNNRYILGSFDTANTIIQILALDGGSAKWVHGNTGASSTPATSGVYAVTPTDAYKDGVDIGNVGGWSGTSDKPIFLGCRNADGTPGSFTALSIQAVAIYSATLTLADVVAITAAMNALPTAAAAKGLPVIAHHYRQIFGG